MLIKGARSLPFNIRRDIQDNINIAVLRKFSKENGVDYQGNKANVIRNIIIAVRNGNLREETVREFIKEQLWFGKNKHNYFIEIDGETVEEFKDTDNLLRYFQDRGITPFNNIDRINNPEGVSLARFEYDVDTQDPTIVNKVYIGHIERNYTYYFEQQSPVFDPVNTYICTELDLINNILVLRVRSRSSMKASQDINSNTITANYLAKKYLRRYEEDYGIEYLDGAPDQVRNTMYNIEKELTNFIELQFKPKIEEHEEVINKFTEDISDLIGLESSEEPIKINERIVGLLERALVMQDEDVITQYVDGKKGYINMFDFRDDRGGRINARSQHISTPIQTSDIFFDTRETIDEVKLLDSLWVVWFKRAENNQEDLDNMEWELDTDEEDFDDGVELPAENDEGTVTRIKTKIAAYTGFYKIEFKRYLIKEEYDHVLSLIESFT